MPRILITGASRGIGRAIALQLAAPNATLLLHGRDVQALGAVADEARALGAEAEPHPADLADPAAVLALADRIAADGPLDVLVNNAGAAAVSPVTDLALDAWQRSLTVGVTAPFLLAQRLAPGMPAGGSIVNVLSVAVRSPFAGWAAYAATKHALRGLSAVLREELRERGVRVIDVYPAATDTDIWDTVPGDFPRARMMAPQETAAAVAFALSRPGSVVVDTIHLGSLGGDL